jgi:hypothetical protein
MPRTALNARPRVGAALLNSVSRTALAALSLGLGLGVLLPGEARAGCPASVNSTYSSTYNLICSSTTFESGNVINAISPSLTGVLGDSSQAWTVANYGSIQAVSVGIGLFSAGSTVTNGGTIGATATTSGEGVFLVSGGTLTNQSGGTITGFNGVVAAGMAAR